MEDGTTTNYLLLIIEAILVAIFVLYLNFYYGNWKKQHKLVTIISFISWYLPILILFIIPIDISVAYYYKCLLKYNETINKCTDPWLLIDKHSLNVFWHLAYWTTFSLTWFCLPIIQSYAKSGSFTILGKFKSSLIDNAIYYGTYLMIVIIIGIYFIIKYPKSIDLANIKLLVITASNTWGMFLVVIFLGYGLVEVPRNLWSSGDTMSALKDAYAALPILHIDRVEEEEELDILIRKGKQWSNQISSTHKYRHFMDIILDKIEEAESDLIQLSEEGAVRYRDKMYEQNKDFSNRLSSHEFGDCDFSEPLTASDMKKQLKTLEKLHRAIKIRIHGFLRAHALWDNKTQVAMRLEDVESNKISGIRYYRHSTQMCHSVPSTQVRRILSRIEWYWRCHWQPGIIRALAVIAAIVSVLLVWSECTFWVHHPVLSVFARLLQLSASYYNYFTVATVSFFSIGYLSLCVYFTVFRLKLFNYFRLVPNHHSDENSLIFCGMLLSRLTPPLCLNYLGLVHFDFHNTNNSQGIFVETQYTEFMGHLDLIPLIAKGFNIYFPLLVLVLCLFTSLRLGQKIMNFLGLQLLFGRDEFADLATSVEEGRVLLKKERQKHSRYGIGPNVERKKPDYKSTIIELSGRSSKRERESDKERLLAESGDQLHDDFLTPVEYNEASIANDYRLASSTSLTINQPHSSANQRAANQNSNFGFRNNTSTFFKKFWPI